VLVGVVVWDVLLLGMDGEVNVLLLGMDEEVV